VSVEVGANVHFQVAASYESGEPAGGVLVNLRGRDIERAHKQYPEYHGRWPTDHPGWLLRCQPDVQGVTGGDGKLNIDIAGGRYVADVNMPMERSGVRPQVALIDETEDWVVEDGATKAIVLQQLRPVFITTRDPLGEVIREFNVGGEWRGGRAGINLRGQNALVWMPMGKQRISVAAVGYVRRELAIADGIQVREVRLVRGVTESNGSIVVEGMPSALKKEGVDLVGLSRDKLREIWRAKVTLSESGATTFYVPVDTPLVFMLRGSKRRLEFEALQALWVPGNEVRFRFVR
jgi:hypothetical protein